MGLLDAEMLLHHLVHLIHIFLLRYLGFTGEAHALEPQKSENWLYVFKELCYNHRHLADFLKSQISECLGSSQFWLVMVANEKDFLTPNAEI